MRRQTTRITATILAAFLLFILAAAGCGRRANQLPLIAVLISEDVRLAKVDGLRQGLAAAGYHDGEDVRIAVVSAHGSRGDLEQAAARLLEMSPAIAVAAGNIEAQRLKAALARAADAGASGPRAVQGGGSGSRSGSDAGVPLVLMGAASTVESGLVESLRRPGGNVTGLDNGHAELTAKRLELLLTLLPEARNIIALYDPSVAPGRHSLSVAVEAARRLHVSLTPLLITTPEELSHGLAALQPGDADAILLLSTSLLESAGPQLYETSLRTGIPTMGVNENDVEEGNFAAYGVSYEAQGRQTARFVAKILQGQSPRKLPVETPDNPELVVNLDLARRLGLRVSPVGLAFARIRQGPRAEAAETNPQTGEVWR